MLAGVALGLFYAAMPTLDRSGSAPDGKRAVAPPPAQATANPYAESRRSRIILQGQEGAPTALPEQKSGLISPALVRIVDGDTFWYGGEKIRVADIDTPEVHGRCAYETRLAARATQRMAALLSAGPFELEPGGDGRDRDRYGRKLRIVVRDGQSLGRILVAEGLARKWEGRREPWC